MSTGYKLPLRPLHSTNNTYLIFCENISKILSSLVSKHFFPACI